MTSTTSNPGIGSINTPPATPAQISNHSTSLKATMSQTPIANNKMIACLRCKTKKVKCDGRTPACAACTKARQDCMISDMVTQRIYPRGYIEKLEKHISDLQSLIHTKLRESEETESRRISISYLDEPLTSDNLSMTASSSSSLLVPPYDSSLTPSQDFEGDVSFARLLVQSLSLKENDFYIPKFVLLISDDILAKSQISTQKGHLPPQELADTFLKIYLASEQPCFPFLRQTDLSATFQRVYMYADQHPPDGPTTQDSFRVFMVAAIASLSFSGHSDPSGAASNYYNSALSFTHGLPLTTGIEAIQNLLLLCLFSLNARISLDTWHLSRRCLNICIQEELHLSFQDIDTGSRIGDISSPNSTLVNAQMRRRIFWSSYCLNRICSNVLYDRPPSIPESEIDLEYPISGSETFTSRGICDDASDMSQFNLLIKICRLSTRAATALHSGATRYKITLLLESFLSELSDITLLTQEGPYKASAMPPIYITYSLQIHEMLLCRWAGSALLRCDGAVSQELRQLCIEKTIQTLSMIVTTCSTVQSYGCSQLSFLQAVKSLLVLFSQLLYPELTGSELSMPINSGRAPIQGLDNAAKCMFEYLLWFGDRFGHGKPFLTSLALVFRYCLLQYHRQARLWGNNPTSKLSFSSDSTMMDLGNDSPNIMYQPPFSQQDVNLGKDLKIHPVRNTQNLTLDPSPSARFFNISPQLFNSYDTSYAQVRDHYPETTSLFERMGLQKYPLQLDSVNRDAQISENHSINTASFRKFGAVSRDLESLNDEVLWSSRIQSGILYDPVSSLAFDNRLGSNNQFPIGQRPIALGKLKTKSSTALSMQELTGQMAMQHNPVTYNANAEFSQFKYENPPKMDVDFSGFETSIQFLT